MSDAPHRYTNRLASETSPYLLQHAHNPVDWYPWGPEALERATREEKPIFLSIGYSACHWCHVMERESFEDPAIAEQLNRDFVAIKVDREERPDLDDTYMAAVQAMTGGGGWPMSIFLTPDREPFFGGTYFPPEDRHGLPGFPRVLAAVADAYRNRRDEIAAQARALAGHLRAQLAVPPGSGDIERGQLQAAVAAIATQFDAVHGGFGPAPKFPAPMTLELLLRAWRRDGDAGTLRMVTATLDAMADGGIRDHLAGGFSRYSTDARWLVPHFEKMLYDNAQLAHCYLEAWRATGEDRFARVASQTLDFLLAELQAEDGGFAAALDADSEGEEGRYYTWTLDALRAALGEAGLDEGEQAALARHWGVTEAGNWEHGRNILHRAESAPAAADLVERGRGVLRRARARRPRPARDDKQVAAWNGMALRALALGALVLDDVRYLDAARRCGQFIAGTLVREEDGLWRTARDGRAHTPAFAEDYANVADGMLALHAATGEGAWLELAERLLARLLRTFWDDASGTLFDTSAEHDGALLRPRSQVDGATPSANAVAADVLLQLALLRSDPDLDRRARSILRAFTPGARSAPALFGRLLAAADRALGEPIDAVVVAPRSDDALAGELRRAAAAVYQPDLVIAGAAVGAGALDEASWPVLAGKTPQDGRATAYVCRGYACEAPTSDWAEVRRQVAALAARVSRAGN